MKMKEGNFLKELANSLSIMRIYVYISIHENIYIYIYIYILYESVKLNKHISKPNGLSCH